MKSEFFSPAFLETLTDDYDDSVIRLADEYHRAYSGLKGKAEFKDDLYEISSIVAAYISLRKNETVRSAQPDTFRPENTQLFLQAEKLHAQERIKNRTIKEIYERDFELYKDLFSKTPVYEFNEEDIPKIQELLDTLRDEIRKSKLISESHKLRLLKRLEKLQSELHKKTSTLEDFFAFMGMLGIEIKKFGELVQPIAETAMKVYRFYMTVIGATDGVDMLSGGSIFHLGDGK